MQHPYSFRLATPADEPFLWKMLYLALYIPEGQPPPDREVLQDPSLAHYVAGWGQRRGDQGVIAVDDHSGQPVGAAWFRLFSADDPSWGFIDADTPDLSIAILPEHQGKGLGRRLLERLIDVAAQEYPALSLSVDPNNRPALRLYEQLGFTVVGTSGTSLTMRKAVSDPHSTVRPLA